MLKRQITQTVREERLVRGGRRLGLTFHSGESEHVPAILLLPSDASADKPVPAGLLLHGYTSRKERMAESVGMALLGHGVASLAVDLPLHGERATDQHVTALRNPLAIVAQWQLALDEATLSLGFLAARREVDRSRLAVVGYSLGSFLAISVTAADPRVRALVLAAGGDLPGDLPFEPLIRAVVDPVRSVRALAGRPLLMVHGRRDRTVRPEQARRVFDAAPEPKELRWWDTGHWLGPEAIEDAAAWLGERLASAELQAMRR
jgi:fermentation-respiration switch protein FrsA (DUF1100 family)